jgi:WXG100 family type VII secretion target
MQISVDSEQLHSTGDSFGTIVQEIKGTISSLNSAANTASSGWSGSSHTAFHDLWTKLHSSLDLLSSAMGDISGNLHAAGNAYSTTESNIAKSAGK